MRSTTARRSWSPRGRARTAAVLSSLGALLLAVTVVWQSASASFTDGTAAVRATAATATISLTDDDAETRLFTVTGLKPGDSTAARCITVRSLPTLRASDVRMYVTGASSSRSMYSYLNVTVRFGTSGAYGSCTGFKPLSQLYTGRLSAFPTDSWSNGTQVWTPPATGEYRTYEVTVSLSGSTPTSVQGGTAGVSFVWESRWS
jgi:hypothetical protein